MADIYRQVYTSFWQDQFVLSLTPEEKYFYLYLFTNSKTSICGIYELPLRIAEFETGYNRETIDKLLHKFEEYEKIKYSIHSGEICVRNFMKYNANRSPKIKSAVDKALEAVKDKTLIPYVYGIDMVLSVTVTVTVTDTVTDTVCIADKPQKQTRFVPPSIEEVKAYCEERKNGVDYQRFIDYYTANGFKVGKNPMKDWKATVRTWERNSNAKPNGTDSGNNEAVHSYGELI